MENGDVFIGIAQSIWIRQLENYEFTAIPAGTNANNPNKGSWGNDGCYSKFRYVKFVQTILGHTFNMTSVA